MQRVDFKCMSPAKHIRPLATRDSSRLFTSCFDPALLNIAKLGLTRGLTPA